MNKSRTMPLFLISLLVILALACASGAPATAPAPAAPATATPDTQATVNAAIAATSTAQGALQATVNSAVSSTSVALPPTATPVPEADYVNMTEEELEALINQAVEEAVAATTEASAATTQATADDSVSQEEVQTVEVYVSGAEQAIAYADELIGVYYDQYGELAAETVDLLLQVEQDLETTAQATAAMAASLAQIESGLEQGAAQAQEAINQLEAVAQQAAGNLDQIKNQAQTWTQQAQQGRENRANQVANIQPDNIPADLPATLQSGFAFIDQVRNALGDNKLTQSELFGIAQLGANFSAGLNAHGGPKFQGLSGSVGQITQQLARGQTRQARDGLGGLESGLGQRPGGGPGGGGVGPGGGGPGGGGPGGGGIRP